MIFGKLIGGLLGFMTLGLFGALIGVSIGHFFDKGLGRAMGFDYGADRQRLQQLFFETSFKVMGHLAKADGRISEAEVSQAESLMSQLGLTDEHRRQAISYFKAGAQADFDLQSTIAAFVAGGGRGHNLPIMLLEFLFSIAMADGELHPSEKAILTSSAGFLGMNTHQFEQLLAMLLAQQSFQQHGSSSQYSARSSADELRDAYQALGVDSDISDRELKRAYRKLMSQHHPDKLIAQGVPDDMMKVATEKAQEIQVAYDLIKKSRSLS